MIPTKSERVKIVMRRVWGIFLCSLIVVYPVNGVCQEQILEAKTDRTKVKTGEIFTYTVKINGDFVSPKIILPDFKNFDIVAQNRFQNYSSQNGTTHLQVNLTYKLLATKPGKFTIEKVIMKDKGKEVKSGSVSIDVSGKPIEKKPNLSPYIRNAIEI